MKHSDLVSGTVSLAAHVCVFMWLSQTTDVLPPTTPSERKESAPIKVTQHRGMAGEGKGECRHYVPGIGIFYWIGSGLVSGVRKGFPADQAGMRKGDILIDDAGGPWPGGIGDEVDVVWRRGKVVMKKRMRLVKVCRVD